MDRLVGSKYMAVKTLMEYPDVCPDKILKLVSEHGWDGSLMKHNNTFLCSPLVAQRFQKIANKHNCSVHVKNCQLSLAISIKAVHLPTMLLVAK